VSTVRYELSFISQKTAFFIVIAVKTSHLTFSREGCRWMLLGQFRQAGQGMAQTTGYEPKICSFVCRFIDFKKILKDPPVGRSRVRFQIR
jgi:hypothetical protein